MSDTVRIITTCTSRKVLRTDRPACAQSLPQFAKDVGQLPAEELYAGEQHRRLMAGVHELRAHRKVEVWVISAGAGLVRGDQSIAAYDEAFAGLSPEALRMHADRLGIAAAVRSLVAKPCAQTFLLAGNDYFDAARFDEAVAWGSPTVALVSPSRALRMLAHPQLRTIAIGQADARQWSLPLTLLKGEIARRMLSDMANGQTPSITELAQTPKVGLLESHEHHHEGCS